MHIRLTYFDFPFWRAEVSRLSLHLGGVPFDDVRPTRVVFGEMKAARAYPYGQLPVLEVDGVVIAQSAAIARLCGRLGGFYPTDDVLAAARVDEILDAANEITLLVTPSLRESDPDRRAAKRHVLGTETLPARLALLEARLAQHSGGHFFVWDALTIADFAIWRLLGWLTSGMLDGIPTDLLEPHPGLRTHFRAIEAREDVQTWMQSHYGTQD